MKIRADFVTNSSSSSYVDIYADNPALNELLEKYNRSADDAFMHYTTDFCDEHEILYYSNTLLEFLNTVGVNGEGMREEIEKRKNELLGGFRYAKYNTGFHYTDGYLSGEEHHITLSSRWGVIDQHTWIDEEKDHGGYRGDEEGYDDEEYDDEDEEKYDDADYVNEDTEECDDEDFDDDDNEDEDTEEYDDENEYNNLVPNQSGDEDDWEKIETDRKERPTEETAGFEGVRPEDLEKRTDLSDKLRMVMDNLSKEPVQIEDKKFVFIGDYDQYLRIATCNESEDEDEDNWDDWDEENTDPWEDREYAHVIRGNIPEIGMISLWLEPLGGRIKSIRKSSRIGTADYVVVRLDSWAEECIDTDVISEAVEKGIPIISEYQLWKAIFG